MNQYQQKNKEFKEQWLKQGKSENDYNFGASLLCSVCGEPRINNKIYAFFGANEQSVTCHKCQDANKYV